MGVPDRPELQVGGDWLPEAVSIAYPLGDILLLAAAIRLAVDRGMRAPAFYLLAGSIVCLLLTDSVYNRMLLDGSYNGQVILDVGWIFYYLLWGAAALHPSMRTLEQPAEPHPADAAAAPVPERGLPDRAGDPASARSGQHRRDRGDRRRRWCCSRSCFARMAGLVRQEERAVARERTLRRPAPTLVGAASLDHIGRGRGVAARELAGADADARLIA